MGNLTKKDFESNNEVRWCPGCGNHAVLATMQRTLPQLGIPKEKIVFISGIGCASRFPYYVDAYGFHTIHGRATAVATGLKLSRPDLSVWIVIGDGDALSIGLNHTINLLRRNLNVNILLLNNQIYGLTKGQYSPTSERGKVSKTSPMGSLETPLNPVKVALNMGSTFVARAIDTDAKNLQNVLTAAVQHKGTSFVEILQNCNIFNDGTFSHITDKKVRAERTMLLQHKRPLVFGNDNSKGLALTMNFQLDVVDAKDPELANHLLVHNMKSEGAMPEMLSQLQYPDFPVPIGIFRSIEQPTYEDKYKEKVKKNHKKPDIEKLFNEGHTWEV